MSGGEVGGEGLVKLFCPAQEARERVLNDATERRGIRGETVGAPALGRRSVFPNPLNAAL